MTATIILAVMKLLLVRESFLGVMNKFLLNSVKISYIPFGSSVTCILRGSISWTTQLKVVWKPSYTELKKVSLKYFFHVDGQLLQVCKTFFLDTLSVKWPDSQDNFAEIDWRWTLVVRPKTTARLSQAARGDEVSVSGEKSYSEVSNSTVTLLPPHIHKTVSARNSDPDRDVPFVRGWM